MHERAKVVLFSTAALLASPAIFAQEAQLVNISGATLFRDFFTANNAGTHDFLDVDGDGRVTGFNPIAGGIVVDQLAQTWDANEAFNGIAYDPANPGNGSNSGTNTEWRIAYRGTGSVNGLRDLINWRNGATPATLAGDAQLPFGDPSTINRTAFANGSGITGVGVAGNPAGIPFRSAGTPGYDPLNPTSTGGIRIDIAPLDVPTSFAIQSSTASGAGWQRGPGEAGYGTNATTSFGGASNQLITANPTLSSAPAVNFNTSSPDANTVFDTQIAWSPVAFIVNRGVGLGDRDGDGNAGDIKKTELQHLFVTGRMDSGENLFAMTRDSGSGTRNAAMNSIGVDPSFGRGDNNNAIGSSSSNSRLGNFEWTNRASSSRMNEIVARHRLGVGYTGLQGGSAASVKRLGGDFEIANIQNDTASTYSELIDATFKYVRPGVDAVLDNLDPTTGYQVGGSQTFATVGDPLATRTGNDTRALSAHGFEVENQAAADYINNITAAIAAFVDTPGNPETEGTPGELLAFGFTLVGAVDALSPTLTPEEFEANAALNQALQDWTRANSLLNTSENPGTYGSVNAAGEAGVRADIAGFSDAPINANTNGGYITNNGVLVSEGSALSARHLIAGDFNGDNARNLNDAQRMVDALVATETGTLAARQAWATAPGAAAGDSGLSFEVTGDFDGNGSFDRDDARYWADGLAMTAGADRRLNRKAGFTAVDDAFGGNTFGTTLATGKSYESGDSRADIAGNTQNAGGLFQGFDGTVDAADIDFIYDQFKTNAFVTDGVANWDNLDEAVAFDLSADLTGDLIVDQQDIDEIVEVVLGTAYGDAGLDGVVNGLDVDALAQAFGTATGAGWANADFNGDNAVNGLDVDFLAQNFGFNAGGGLALGVSGFNSFVIENHSGLAEQIGLIPEPATLTLLAMSGLGLVSRRGRR